MPIQETVPAIFLQPAPPPAYRRWVTAGLAVLFLAGIAWFGFFFDWGSHALFLYDWSTLTGPRFLMLKNAMLAWQLPLHAADPSAFAGITLRYLAVPDTLISPQYVLLRWMTVQRFNLVNVWLLYALGFAGLVALKQRLRLSLLSFAALFFLFNFNGHILAHYGVGQAQWGGYFLLPWFAWLVLKLLDGDRSWASTLGFTALLLAAWLQGSYAQVAWMLIFLLAVGVFAPGARRMAACALVFALPGCALRLLPASLLADGYSLHFESGYPGLAAVWDALVRPADMRDLGLFTGGPLSQSLGSWETTAFTGLVGGLFLAYFGIFRGLIHSGSPFRKLALPLGLLLALATGSLANILPIPMMPGESIPTRAFGVVLVFLLVLAAERFQRMLDESAEPLWMLAFGVTGLAFILVDLWGISNVWRVSNGTMDFWRGFQPEKWAIRNEYADTLYLGLAAGGLALSVTTLAVLGWLAWKERSGARAAPSQPGGIEHGQ